MKKFSFGALVRTSSRHIPLVGTITSYYNHAGHEGWCWVALTDSVVYIPEVELELA